MSEAPLFFLWKKTPAMQEWWHRGLEALRLRAESD
jgi:hypothetical protein